MNNINSISAPLPALPVISEEGMAANKANQQDLKKIGEDFESIFMSLMLKEMRNTISSEEGGGLFAGEGSDTYGGMFDMFLGQHLAEGSHLGIGSAIESYLANRE